MWRFVASYSKAGGAWLPQVSRCHMIHQMLDAHSDTIHLHTAVAHSCHSPCSEGRWRNLRPAAAPTPFVNTLSDQFLVRTIYVVLLFFVCMTDFTTVQHP